MNDESIDELLRDLNKALSVEPSPAVAAKVRIRIREQGAPRTGWVGWVTVAGMALVAMAYLSAPLDVDEPDRLASPLAAPHGTDIREVSQRLPDPLVTPESASRGPAGRATNGAAAHAVTRSATGEPEVLVPPSVRLAYEALRRQIAEGRITSESFTPAREFEGPRIVGPTVLDLVPFEVETVHIESAPAESIDPFPSSKILDKTRTHS
jgi:hypothetical protein